MREQDVNHLRDFIRENLSKKSIRKVLFCSADQREIDIIKEFFPGAEIIITDQERWNIDDPCPYNVDLMIVCNVFMCARDPLKWFNNCLHGTNDLVVLDHIQAYRGGSEGETSPSTGDLMRYKFVEDSYVCDEFVGRFHAAFNLATLPQLKTVKAFSYPSGCGVEGYEVTKMFVALIGR